MDLHQPSEVGLWGLIALQVIKTAREWLRGKRRHLQVMEQVQSTNRKVFDLTTRLEKKGFLTPDPLRGPVRSPDDPVTVIMRSPLYRGPLLPAETPTKKGG